MRLYNHLNETDMEKFEIVFDRAKNNNMAMSNGVELALMFIDQGLDIDIEQIIEIAEEYGWDLSDFEYKLKWEQDNG